MPKKFRILFVAHPVIHQHQSAVFFDQQAAEGQADHVVFIGGVESVPDAFGHHSVHGPAIQFEVPAVDGI